MDPLRAAGAPILSEEWFIQQKKLLKQSGMEKTSAASAANDVYLPSSAATEAQGAVGNSEAVTTPGDKFLTAAASEIMQMDPNSESFLSDATSALVDSALGQVFGEKLMDNPGYPQMHSKITKAILSEDHYREVVEDFLNAFVAAQGVQEGVEAEFDQEFPPEAT